MESTLNPSETQKPPEDAKLSFAEDSGIFDFMTPERAIELYNLIHSSGPPELDWKFHGRRRLDENDQTDMNAPNESNPEKEEADSIDQNLNEQTVNTEFDFDEEPSTIDDNLHLKKRTEPNMEKKTNLSDIMSDIMKESHVEDVS